MSADVILHAEEIQEAAVGGEERGDVELVVKERTVLAIVGRKAPDPQPAMSAPRAWWRRSQAAAAPKRDMCGGFPSSSGQKLGTMIASQIVMASKDAATGKLAPARSRIDSPSALAVTT